MGINSRSKGNRNERKAAESLTTWTNRKFERTPSSGGLQWKASFSKGDLVCTKEGHYFPFCVEVKAHKEINFAELLMPGKKGVKILEFWAQCKRDADKCGKIPMLMMRYDRMPSDLFFLGLPIEFTKQIVGLKQLDINLMMTFWDKKNQIKIALYPSTDFFKLPYKEIKLIAKTFLGHGKKK